LFLAISVRQEHQPADLAFFAPALGKIIRQALPGEWAKGKKTITLLIPKIMKTILVPTDFSDNAINALYYAEALASQTQSQLVLVHAIARDVIELPGNPFSLQEDLRLERYYLGKLESLASPIRAKYGPVLPVATHCVQGHILEHLNELVTNYEADLVVMGTKGAHHQMHRLMGTHTVKYLRQAICPVLAIPLTAHFQGWHKIGYAADFETSGIVFLRQLFRLIEPLKAEVFIFNIKSEDQVDLVPDSQVLRQIQSAFPDNRYSLCQLQDKSVAAGIVAFFRENQMDLLVLGIHQHDLLEKLLQVSVSENLAFAATLPLLALPEKPFQ
jgi:nucleotide-binding universal stress UspA family protein